MADLGNIDPTHEPRVTDTITKIISSIEKFLSNTVVPEVVFATYPPYPSK